MFQASVNIPEDFPGFAIRFLQQSGSILAACAWLMTTVIGASSAFAFSILRGGIVSPRVGQESLVWAIAETSASNQQGKKGGNRDNPEDGSLTLCVKRMDACYENCKLAEAQPGSCNLSCTTDKICGVPVRMSYGQFLDFQVEMLAANANISTEASQSPQNAKSLPEQPVVLPEPKRRPQHNRPPNIRAKPASGRPGGGSAQTGSSGNSGWPHISWPQIDWPHF